jgi:hypothetical protein
MKNSSGIMDHSLSFSEKEDLEAFAQFLFIFPHGYQEVLWGPKLLHRAGH